MHEIRGRTGWFLFAALIGGALAAVAPACGDDDGGSGTECRSGTSRDCECDDGSDGEQRCGASGTYGRCVCDGEDDDGGPDPDGDDAGTGGDDDLCTDECAFADDGTCDDGARGSQNMACDYGSDCRDCGARPDLGGCEPSCALKTCGDDGCDGTCGECASGETCDEERGRCGGDACVDIGDDCEAGGPSCCEDSTRRASCVDSVCCVPAARACVTSDDCCDGLECNVSEGMRTCQ